MILFLGSGISLASKLPSVSEIRTKLLSNARDSSILNLLNLLLDLDTKYLEYSAPYKDSTGRFGYTGQIFRSQTTYEDLFYLVDQIETNGAGLSANITIDSFADLVRRRSRSFLQGKEEIEQDVELHKLAIKTRRFILETVYSLLYTTEVKGLDLVLALANSPHVSKLTIVTLNHDTLIEQLLIDNQIHYTDGFGNPDGDVRWFEDAFSEDTKIRLIKLHGSISWWGQGGDKVLQPVNILDNTPSNWKNSNNELIEDIRSVPSFLTGINKVYSYNRGIFADQNYRFLQVLHSDNMMVMSGYGWGDIPINFQLQNWLNKNKKNILVMLHRNPMELANKSLELRHIYNKYTTSGQIIPIKKWLSETPLEEIRGFIQ